MQDVQEFKETERFAVEEAERERIWQEEYGSKMDEVIASMDSLLQKGTEESRQELHDMFLNKNFFEHYKQTDAIAIMYVVMEIYERERAADVYPTILECGKTVGELRRYLEQLKFILYRVDFGVDSESEQELVAYLKKYQTSMITIETMITTTAMRPMELVLKLEQIFEKNFMYKELFGIRNFINNRWKGNHRILMKLAELYEQTGHEEYARECIIQIPGELRGTYKDNPTVLLIQEKLWKIRYKNMVAVENLAKMLQMRGIAAETWEMLLTYEAVRAEEYYLILAEELLEKNMIDLAVRTLKVGAQMIPENEVIDGLLAACEARMR